MKQKVTYYTLGCKLNFAETSTIGKQFSTQGFVEVSNESISDVVVINTCSVTERADQKARQTIRHFQSISPNAYIIVTGCYAQLDPEEISKIEGVDLVLGSSEKFHVFDYVKSFEKSGSTQVFTGPIEDAHEFGGAFSMDVGNRTRVFLKVQDGCDYSCTYCTIPLARGVSRSPSIHSIIKQAQTIIDSGVKEIVLSGVNVGDFGKRGEGNLFQLLSELNQLTGDIRYRISSIEPNLLTDEIIQLIVDSEKFCQHFHIPMQSGSDTILKKMKRRYLTNDYKKRIEIIQSKLPNAGIGADVIVGFPGETDELFEETVNFISSLPLSYLHVFTYSERERTEAWDMDGEIPLHIRKKRNAHLRLLSKKMEHAFNERMMGSLQNILLEKELKDGYQMGYSGNYLRVGIQSEADVSNQIKKVRIVKYLNEVELIGEII